MTGLLGLAERMAGLDLEAQVRTHVLEGRPHRMERVYEALALGYGSIATACAGITVFGETFEIKSQNRTVEVAADILLNRLSPGATAIAAGTVTVEAIRRRRRARALVATHLEA